MIQYIIKQNNKNLSDNVVKKGVTVLNKELCSQEFSYLSAGDYMLVSIGTYVTFVHKDLFNMQDIPVISHDDLENQAITIKNSINALTTVGALRKDKCFLMIVDGPSNYLDPVTCVYDKYTMGALSHFISYDVFIYLKNEFVSSETDKIKYPNILSTISPYTKAFKIVKKLSDINTDDNGSTDLESYAIMEDVNGKKYLFSLKNSAVTLPSGSSNKILPSNEVCFVTKNNKGMVMWFNSPSWVKGTGVVAKVKDVNVHDRKITTVNGKTYDMAHWITEDDLDFMRDEVLHPTRSSFLNVKSLDGIVVSYDVGYGERSA